MKAKVALILLAVLTVIVIITWWGREVDPDELRPTLRLGGVAVRNISSKSIDMNTRILIDNPLPVDLKTKGMRYELFVNGERILQSANDHALKIRSKDSTSVLLPMVILTEPLIRVLDKLEKQKADSADYELKTTLLLDLPLKGKTELNSNVIRRLPAFRSFKMKPQDIDLKKLALKESKLKMIIKIDNPNVFPFKMKDMVYDVKLGEELAMHADIAGITNIPPKSSTQIPVELEIKNKEMLKLMGQTLFGKGNAQLNVDFIGKIVSESNWLNNSKITMRTSGTVKGMKDVIKETKEETE
jgi:LEA14-like dessication related protein